MYNRQHAHQQPRPVKIAGCRAELAARGGRELVTRPAVETRTQPIILNTDVARSLSHMRLEVVDSLEQYVDTQVLPLLRHAGTAWQPSDLLPDASQPDFLDKVADLRVRASHLPDDYLVVFVGDMVTEEALPTYMSMLNRYDGITDESGASPTPWAKWIRHWTSEEKRHGDVMNKYMYLTGRVNMHAIEVTVQNLISSGMNPQTESNPYLGFIYTSFQERATKISHGNTARHALQHGDEVLAKICGAIAADEGRHEQAYQRIMDAIFERDPNGATLAFADMMRRQIVMPAHLMDDNTHVQQRGRTLFADFSAVAQRTGTYTAHDYAAVTEHLINRWKVNSRRDLTGEACDAAEYLVRLPNRIRALSERAQARKKARHLTSPFSWVFDRPVEL